MPPFRYAEPDSLFDAVTPLAGPGAAAMGGVADKSSSTLGGPMTTTIHDEARSERAIIRDILWSVAEREISLRNPDAMPQASLREKTG